VDHHDDVGAAADRADVAALLGTAVPAVGRQGQHLEALPQRHLARVVGAGVVDHERAVGRVHGQLLGHRRQRAGGAIGRQHDRDPLRQPAVDAARPGRRDALDPPADDHSLVEQRGPDHAAPGEQSPGGACHSRPRSAPPAQAVEPVAGREVAAQGPVLAGHEVGSREQLAERHARQQKGVSRQQPPPTAAEGARRGRRGIGRHDAQHSARAQEPRGAADRPRRPEHVLDHVHHEDRVERPRFELRLVEALGEHLEPEPLARVRASVVPRLESNRLPAEPPCLVHEEPVTAADVEQAPRRGVAVGQGEQPARGAAATLLLVEVAHVPHVRVQRAELGRRGELALLDRAA
jgi:hypothetical protein